MPKGYLVANIRVKDPEIFKKFSQTALPIIEQYGGKILHAALMPIVMRAMCLVS